MGNEQKYADLAPGLEQTIEAGDTLVMRDNDGNEFAVSAKEHPNTLAFFRAFDEWVTAKMGGLASMETILWAKMMTEWNNLPTHITRELPSFKALILRGHSH